MGHGLNYHNLQEVAAIHGFEELNIGHRIITFAALLIFDRAVKKNEICNCGWCGILSQALSEEFSDFPIAKKHTF
jgi:hypothetical protein